MGKKAPIPLDELENALEHYYARPEPDPKFVARLEHRLRSRLIEKETQKMLGKTKTPRLSRRAVWGLGLALTAMAIGLLAASPSLAAAMMRLLGYVPGVGMVEQSAPLRVLARPVSQTRGEITITVTEAVLSVDKTVIVYNVENIPPENLTQSGDTPGCLNSPEVHLLDGSQLEIMGVSGHGWESGYENRLTFAPIPADVDEAVLFILCIQDTQPGTLPENWELSLSFVPAPPDMTVMPVVEVSPESTAAGSESMGQNPITISNVVDTGDSFILIGEFNPPAPDTGGEWWTSPVIPKLMDASGQEIFYSYPDDIDLPLPEDMRAEVWAVKVEKGFASPLTVLFQTTYIIANPQEFYTFEFDAGADPQPGQTWELNREIQMGGHTFTLDSISAQQGHQGGLEYSFLFSSTGDNVTGVHVSIEGYQPQGGSGGSGGDERSQAKGGGGGGGGGGSAPQQNSGGGGGGGGSHTSNFGVGLSFAELPKGKLNITLSDLQVYGETQEWSLDWVAHQDK